jgi:hypothetical protein
MAKTYTAASTLIAFASNKSMLGIYNSNATNKVKIYRVWQLNNQTDSVTANVTSLALRRISAFSGGTAVTPVAHDTANTNYDLTSVTCATNGAFTNTSDAAFRVWMWSDHQPSVTAATSDEFECIIPLMCIWDSSGDTNLEPIVCNTSEGVHVVQAGTNAVGTTDIFMEFTVST